MNKLIKRNINKYLTIFILLQPILDLITGIAIHNNINLTLGIIIRMIFLISIVYITLFVYKAKKVLVPYILIFLYCIFYIIGILIFKENPSLFQEFQGLLRTIYFPTILISMYYLKERIKVSKKVLLITLITYLTLIFIPTIFNIGFKSYQITKSGTLGFFNSANEISGIISILTPIMFIYLKLGNKITPKIILIILYLFVILNVGTKTPLLALLITTSLAFLWILINCIKQKKYKIIIFLITTILIGFISLLIIVPKTNFYKNIKVHIDYLEIKNIQDIIKSPIIFDHLVFSERLTFFNNKKNIYDNSSIYQKLFGIGYIENNKTTKLIEIDYYDIYFSHGLIGTIVLFSIYIYVLINIIKEKRKIDFTRSMVSTSLLLIIILSMFTGHIITSPAVSIFVVMIIMLLYDKNKSKEIWE